MRHDAGPDTRERVFAGRTAGALWMAGAAAIGGLTLIPGVHAGDPTAAIVLSAVGIVWGVLCAFAIPWGRWQSQLLFHVPALLCLPYLGVSVAATGGARRRPGSRA